MSNEARTQVESRSAEAKRARRDAIVLEHLPLVKAIAMQVFETLPVHVDLDDLVHAGVLGLIDAASRFDMDRSVAFSAYAKHRVRGAILDSLRQQDLASRDLRRRCKQAEAVSRDLALELKRNPTEEELAERLGVGVDRLRKLRSDLRNVGMVAPVRGDSSDEAPALEFPGRPEHQPDAMFSQEAMRSALSGAIQSLPPRYQKVVALYYTSDMTMKEIGKELGINESRVSQIHKSALMRMEGVLQSAGITSCQAFG